MKKVVTRSRDAAAGRESRAQSVDYSARAGAWRDAVHARIRRYGYDANYLRGRIIGALGSMAAEQEVFNVGTTGAENDPPGVCVSDQVSPWAQRRRTRQCAASSDFGDGAVIACSALS